MLQPKLQQSWLVSLREAPWLTSPNWPKHYICAHCKNKIQRCKFCNTAKYFASESLTCSCWEWSNIGIAVHLMFHRHTLTSINISQQISSFISIFSFTFDPMLNQHTLTDHAPSIFDVSSNSVTYHHRCCEFQLFLMMNNYWNCSIECYCQLIGDTAGLNCQFLEWLDKKAADAVLLEYYKMLFDFKISIRAQLSKWQTQWCQYIFQSKNKSMFLVVSVIHAADHNFQNSSRQRSIILWILLYNLLISTPPISLDTIYTIFFTSYISRFCSPPPLTTPQVSFSIQVERLCNPCPICSSRYTCIPRRPPSTGAKQ